MVLTQRLRSVLRYLRSERRYEGSSPLSQFDTILRCERCAGQLQFVFQAGTGSQRSPPERFVLSSDVGRVQGLRRSH
jgi:hypothetical protein